MFDYTIVEASDKVAMTEALRTMGKLGWRCISCGPVVTPPTEHAIECEVYYSATLEKEIKE